MVTHTERIARVKKGWLQVAAWQADIQGALGRRAARTFHEGAGVLATAGDRPGTGVAGARPGAAALEAWLVHEDRHLRGNAALRASAGSVIDVRFDTIAAILVDRRPGRRRPARTRRSWSLQKQIRADRYYAARLLGDLKDPRGASSCSSP